MVMPVSAADREIALHLTVPDAPSVARIGVLARIAVERSLPSVRHPTED